MTGEHDKAEETAAQSPDPYAPDAAAEPDPPAEHVEADAHGDEDTPTSHFEQQDHRRF